MPMKSLILLLFTVCVIQSKSSKSLKSLSPSVHVLDSLRETFIRTSFPYVIKYSNEFVDKISSKCMTSLLSVYYGIRNRQKWALKFIDASAKIPNGLFETTITDFGDFEQCLALRIPFENLRTNNNESVSGNYCLMQITRKAFTNNETKNATSMETILSNFRTLRIGLCLPSVCQQIEIQIILNRILKDLNVNAPVSNQCYTEEYSTKLDSRQIFAMYVALRCRQATSFKLLFDRIVSVSTVILVLIATAVDIRFKQKSTTTIFTQQSAFVKVLRCWSFGWSASKIFRFTFKRQELLCLHGIRVITIIWMLLANTFLFGSITDTSWLNGRLSAVAEFTRTIYAQPLLNVWIVTETFFYLSGLLMVYAIIPKMSTKNKESLFVWILVRRVFRLLPSIFGLFVLFWLFSTFLKGPFLLDEQVQQINASVNDYFYYNFLFVSNWIYPQKMSWFSNLWYVSADMQIYIGMYIVLLVLYNNPKSGMCLTAVILLVSVVSSAFLTYSYDLKPTVLGDDLITHNFQEYISIVYYPTCQHLSSTCIGVITGFLILNKPFLLKNVQTTSKVILWLILPGFNVCLTFITYFWNNGHPVSTSESLLYSSVHRVLWCSGLAWLSYSCTTGHAGFIKHLLQSKIFIPLSRLSFGICISHLWIIYCLRVSIKSPVAWSSFYQICEAFTIFILSCICAFILYVGFESPFTNIINLFLRQRQRRIRAQIEATTNVKCHCIPSLNSSVTSAFKNFTTTPSANEEHSVLNNNDPRRTNVVFKV